MGSLPVPPTFTARSMATYLGIHRTSYNSGRESTTAGRNSAHGQTNLSGSRGGLPEQTTAFAHDDAEIDQRTIDIDGKRIPYESQAIWSGLASTSGLPATVMPIGSSGLPVGVQIIGPYPERRPDLPESARNGCKR